MYFDRPAFLIGKDGKFHISERFMRAERQGKPQRINQGLPVSEVGQAKYAYHLRLARKTRTRDRSARDENSSNGVGF